MCPGYPRRLFTGNGTVLYRYHRYNGLFGASDFAALPGEPVPLFAHITAMAMHGVLPGQIKVLLRLATLMLTLKISRCGHNSNGAPKITASPSRETEACELARLFERFGTDKLPMHHYQRAYCPILEPFRLSARIVVELGFFRGSGCAAFATYFQNAAVYGIDNAERYSVTAVPSPDGNGTVPGHRGVPLNLGPRQQHVHLFKTHMKDLESRFEELRELGRSGVGLPTKDIDVLIDDADHFKSTQINNFQLWFPRLRDGGIYIIEDIFMTPVPWPGWNAPDNLVPSTNDKNGPCKPHCYYPQRPAEHWLLSQQPPEMRRALENRSWFITITGTHAGGGLDMMMVIVK